MSRILERLRNDPRVREVQLMRRIRRFPYYSPVESASLPRIRLDGHELINLGSNNYLGLSTDPRVIAAATEAVGRWGTGVTGSRLLNGTLRIHEALEERLAGFYGKPAALVFPTGYSANLGLFSGMLTSQDFVAVDREIHASIIDALTLARASYRRFPHNNPKMARRRLEAAQSPCALVVEGVYSMRGDAAPLAAFADVARDTSALLVVDEAHGLGAVGRRGRGGAELAGVLDRVDVFTVTFSKSLASCGGAIIGSRDLIEALKVLCRPFLFTASNTPGSIAAAHKALDILIETPELVAEVQARAAQLRDALHAQGVTTQRSDSPIVTVGIGSDLETIQAWRMLRNRGVFCNPVLTPAVPKGEGLLRLSVMRTHTDEDIAKAAEAFAAITRWTSGAVGEGGSLESPSLASPRQTPIQEKIAS